MEKTRFEPLSAQEQFELAEIAIGSNNEEAKIARGQLVLSMTNLIVENAVQYRIYGPQLDYIIQECYIVLFQLFSPFKPRKGRKGIEARFDPAFNTKPSTYARFWIKHTIRRLAFSEDRNISIPGDLGYQVARFKEILAGKENPSGQTIAQIMKEIGVRPRALKDALKSEQIRSLDRPVQMDNLATLLDLTRDSQAEEEFSNELKLEMLGRIMKEVLNEREIEMIKLRYGLDNNENCTFREIAIKFNLSGSRIGQIIRRSQEKIKEWISEHPECGIFIPEISSKQN